MLDSQIVWPVYQNQLTESLGRIMLVHLLCLGMERILLVSQQHPSLQSVQEGGWHCCLLDYELCARFEVLMVKCSSSVSEMKDNVLH